MNLPIFELLLEDNSQESMLAMALVDNPAVKRNFLKFNEDKKRLHFSVVNEERRIISGLAIAANELIYRSEDKEQNLPAHQVFFSPETVYKFVQMFFQYGKQNTTNIMHNANIQPSDITIFESFISDSTRGIAPMKGFEDASDGSWFTSAFVNNDAVWQMVKDGQLNGFSAEGFFKYYLRQEAQNDTYLSDEELSQHNQILNQIQK